MARNRHGYAPPRTCDHCGTVFRPRTDGVKAGMGRFCSSRCSALGRPQRPTQKYRVIGTKLEHRLRAERALGKPLPKGVEIHHLNGGFTGPIVICENRRYHQLLHHRMRIKAAGGDPNTEKLCASCGVKQRTDFPSNRRTCDGLSIYCWTCTRLYRSTRKVA